MQAHRNRGLGLAVAAALLGLTATFDTACGGGDDSHGESPDAATGDGSTIDGSADAGADAHPCVANGDPGLDQDGDGFTGAQGDCNDCDPLVNPGAIDIDHATGGGAPSFTDDDCDGIAGNDVASCGEGLALDDVTADDAVKAMELCRRASATSRSWGVETAAYVRANGAAFAAPGVQVGIQPSFGANVSPRSGGTMLMLSTGAARTPTQTGACGSASCTHNATGTAPTGFPRNATGCKPITIINDDVAFSVKVRVPTNAVGYAFDTAFYSLGFPRDPCSEFTDQTVVLVSPAPADATNGNVLFDSTGGFISTDTSLMTACSAPTAPTNEWAYDCLNLDMGGSKCPARPSSYCPAGATSVMGTGFDVYVDANSGNYAGGATPWLQTTVPVTPGSEITLQFTIWDSSDQNDDSSVLFDHFHWITSGTVTTATTVAP